MNHGLYFPEAQIYNSNYLTCAATTQSVWGLATSWTVRESNPGGSDIFCSLWPTQPPIQWVPGLYLGVKAAGAGR